MKLTKAEAARQLGVSRTTLYKLIEQGHVSTTSEGLIDSTELVRAAPVVDSLKERTRTPVNTQPVDASLQDHAHPELSVDTVYGRSWTDESGRQQTSTVHDLVDIFREQVQLMREELREVREEARVREARAGEREALLLRMLHESQQRYDRLLEAPRPTVPGPPAPVEGPRLAPGRTDPPAGPVDVTTRMPAYNPDTHTLGVLCKRGHDWQGTGLSLRKRSNQRCLACDAAQARARTAARRS